MLANIQCILSILVIASFTAVNHADNVTSTFTISSHEANTSQSSEVQSSTDLQTNHSTSDMLNISSTDSGDSNVTAATNGTDNSTESDLMCYFNVKHENIMIKLYHRWACMYENRYLMVKQTIEKKMNATAFFIGIGILALLLFIFALGMALLAAKVSFLENDLKDLTANQSTSAPYSTPRSNVESKAKDAGSTDDDSKSSK